MRAEITKPFHQIGNTNSLNISAGSGSVNVTVPFPREGEYVGTMRVWWAQTGTLAYVKLSNTANPVATSADAFVPGGVLCFFELEADTISIGCQSPGSGILSIAFGSGGV